MTDIDTAKEAYHNALRARFQEASVERDAITENARPLRELYDAKSQEMETPGPSHEIGLA